MGILVNTLPSLRLDFAMNIFFDGDQKVGRKRMLVLFRHPVCLNCVVRTLFYMREIANCRWHVDLYKEAAKIFVHGANWCSLRQDLITRLSVVVFNVLFVNKMNIYLL